MKIRKGFVSNSSSSSFVCDVCGNVESGYDASASEVGFANCENGHEFCEDHIVRNLSDDQIRGLIKRIIESGDAGEDFSEMPEAEQFEEIRGVLENKYMNTNSFEEYGFDYELPEECCPICSMQHIPDSEVLTYILKSHEFTRQNMMEKIRRDFQTYGDFKAFIK